MCGYCSVEVREWLIFTESSTLVRNVRCWESFSRPRATKPTWWTKRQLLWVKTTLTAGGLLWSGPWYSQIITWIWDHKGSRLFISQQSQRVAFELLMFCALGFKWPVMNVVQLLLTIVQNYQRFIFHTSGSVFVQKIVNQKKSCSLNMLSLESKRQHWSAAMFHWSNLMQRYFLQLISDIVTTISSWSGSWTRELFGSYKR